MKKQLLLIISLLFLSLISYGQATFTSGSTATQLATQIAGQGLIITNPVITQGVGTQVGTFSNGIAGASFQIDTGIILTSSTVAESFTSNNNIGISLGPNSTYNDPDLTAINGNAIHDVVVFEFDVTLDNIATVITVDFQFAADEYPTYVGSQFNDTFGFFISGPGLTGSQNIALVPGKTIPIQVNNINSGTIGSNQDGTAWDATNSFYYIANSDNAGNGNGAIFSEYNGFTKKIRASLTGLTPNTTYHVKMALADVADNQFDTGVFVNLISGFPDKDSDGIDDATDLDDDNDGILDTVEGTLDTDGDGVINSFDLDSDGDGIPDNIEAQISRNYIAPGTFTDTNLDGVNDVYAGGLTPQDTDGDGTPDYLDLDSDNEATNDTTEAGIILSGNGVGANGLDNALDTTDDWADPNGTLNDPTILPDLDGDVLIVGGEVDYKDADDDNDGIPNTIDLDNDNDGILDSVEGTADPDGDGIPNNRDLDSDGDSIPDNIEAQTTSGYIAPNGVYSATGIDTAYGTGLTPVDTDGDGTKDYLDLNSDNEGANDTTEAGLTLAGTIGLNGLVSSQENNDFWLDVNGTLNDPTTLPDKDGDVGTGGDVDYRDNDDDNDGVSNTVDLDNDNDGILDSVEGTTGDADADGIKDYRDLDSDNDGIPDNIEAQATATYITPNGVYSTTGIDTAYGTGLTPVDTDGDGTKDYLDANSDNDGTNDTSEAGLTLSGTVGLNGLDNNIDTADNWLDTNGTINDPTTLPDKDGDVATGGDVDYRDDDVDNDGIPNATDLDDDNDGILDTVEGTGDPDGDGFPNNIDLDSDGDGIPDNIEAQTTLGYITPGTFTDTNSDGVNDVYAGGLTPVNTDTIDNPDYLDLDSDNEGGNDTTEANLNLVPNVVGHNGLNNNIQTSDDYQNPRGALVPAFLPDTDGDLGSGGDVDYRDAINNLDLDGDGVSDSVDIDDDNDGILDTVEGSGDTDGDGIINSNDLDSDGDGIPDNVEAQTTTGYIAPNGAVASNGMDTAYTSSGLTPVNTDGTDNPDYLDTDSDNQGTNDTTEAGLTLSGTVGNNGLDNNIDTADNYIDVNGIINNPSTLPNTDAFGDVDFRDGDTDNDGIVDSVDLDDDNDGILDTVEGTGDTDGDGIQNSYDLDSDGDGIPDNIEVQATNTYIAPGTFTDANNDGVNDVYAGGFTPPDTDGDGTKDYLDTDTDNDGISDTVEAGLSLSGTIGINGLDNNIDTADNWIDVNGTINNPATLPDDDGDVASGGDVNYRDNDHDNDGINDITDLDDDNDGILDSVEGTGDIDGDGIQNSYDLDSDGDGLPDNVEAQSTLGYTVPGTFTDANNDGVNDVYAGGLTPVNTDGTDNPDYLDTDADNDTILDKNETGLTLSGTIGLNGLDNNIDTVDNWTDVNGTINNPATLPDRDADVNSGGDVDYRDTDNDNDGVNDITDLDDDNDGIVDTIEDFPTNVDTDGDGIKNSFDLDSDGDGIPDNIEAQTTTGYIPPSGNDADGDGLDNAYDTSSGGTAITPVNTDGTDNPDYLDTDSDNQGANDTTEAGLTLSGTIGINGLDNNIDTIDNYTDPNGTINDPKLLPDADGDVLTGGDVDYRDVSNATDNDNDGIVDATDLDDDNDGILDTVEGTGDTDGDGIQNSFDLDSDGDGIPDNIEAQATATYTAPGIFTDANTDGVNDIYAGGLTPVNTDGVDTPDYIDTNSDNEGGTDTVEANLVLSGLVGSNGLDNNIDTVDDYTDVNGSINSPTTLPDSDGDLNFGGNVDFRDATNSPPDNDGDGVPNATDLDDDNDGIVDTIEDSPTNVDTDGDGIKNSFDLDSDGDGIPDNIEAQTTTGYIPPSGNDADGDGLDNAYDTNSGGTAITPVNTDGTDNPDYLDTDSDNQGGNDTVEAALTLSGTIGINGLDNNIDTADTYADPNGTINDPTLLPDTDGDLLTGGDVDYRDISNSVDNDNDGILNAADLDDDNDGILDTVEGTLDTDGDGIQNSYDLDSDNDGLPDNIEAQTTLGYVPPGTFTDANNDGVNDIYAGGLTPVNTDGVDTPDYIDTNSDNEGGTDTVEANLNLSGLVGSNGLDNNIDTIDDYSDPNGSLNTPSFLPDSDGDLNAGGDVDYRDATNSPPDNDNDGIIDSVDIDDDNDGIIDVLEGSLDFDGDGIKNSFDLDSDNDGIPDNIEAQATKTYIAPTGNDTDGDGLDNAYDANNGGFAITFSNLVNTDGTDNQDYLDNDSDNDAILDKNETGFTALNNVFGINGLDSSRELLDNYSDVNGLLNDPTTLPDTDADLYTTGGDVDYRDATNSPPDNDGDGIGDPTDLDDDNDGILDSVEDTPANVDTDGDGIKNAFDLDSDGDGIPDNVEAQTTIGYIAPGTFTDINNDGVNDVYAGGLTPVNTDLIDNPDYLDLDSDNQGANDTAEAGLSLSGTVGSNGLDNNIDTIDNYTDVNGTINNPTTLPDIDSDVNTGGDVDFRDKINNLDHDSDGIPDNVDIDDDNDGILDTVENNCGPVAGYDGYWPLENSTNDSSGNAHNLQAGTVTYSTTSIKGVASASFNGTSNYLQYSDGTYLNQAITNFSYSLWIKPTSLTGIQEILDEGGGTNGIAIRLNGNTLENAVREGGAGTQVSTSSFTFPNDGAWHHIALTYANGTVIMYLDGAASTTLNTGFGSLAVHGSAHAFGRSSGDAFGFGTGNYYGGLMDEILHYPSVLTPQNIADLINGNCDTDGDGVKDSFDIDSDGDGIVDNIEAQTTAGYVAPNGPVATNGMDTAYTASGLTPVNTDGVDTPDYIDTNSDNDVDSDALEGWDIDNNGIADTVPIGNDNDGDGLDDAYDTNDGLLNPTNGQTPMSFPDNDNVGGDRDWRETFVQTLFDNCLISSFDTTNENWRAATIDAAASNLATDKTIVLAPQLAAWSGADGKQPGTINQNDLDGFWTELWTPDLVANGLSTNYSGLIGTSLTFWYKNTTGILWAYAGVKGTNGQEYEYNFLSQIVNPTNWNLITIPLDAAQWTKYFSNNDGVNTDPGGNAPTQVEFSNVLNSVDRWIFSVEGTWGPDNTFFDQFGTSCDAGDASGIAYGEPRHKVDIASTLYLGTVLPDIDTGEWYDSLDDNLNGNDDDLAGVDDEEGVTFTNPLVKGKTTTFNVTVTNSVGVNSYINAWIDWNGDGDFVDAGEQIVTEQVVSGSAVVPINIAVPLTASSSTSYTRFRICSTAGDCNTYSGVAKDGEVEDYQAIIIADNDSDGVADATDLDDDNDGILDTVEGIGDTDGDGIINKFDLDSDGDGIPDNVEAQATNSYTAPGTFTDANTDGVNDVYAGGLTPVNTDGVDTADYLDLDSDNQGGNDTVEAALTLSGTVGNNGLDNNIDTADDWTDVNGTINDPTLLPDSDGDLGSGGDVDFRDATNSAPDNDGDGVADTVDIDDDNDGILDTIEDSPTNVDTDGDGIKNSFDLDSDGDGIPDNIEAQVTVGYISPSGNDADGDGLDNAYDTNSGGTAITPVNTDGTDNPDYLDTDSDNQGANDTTEAGLTLSGTVGNNGLDNNIDTADTYADVNGTINDPTLLPDTDGDLGTGGDVDYRDASDSLDNDNDGIPNSTDLDDDNDGILDTVEGTGDTDGDGIKNSFDLDSDGDGIPDNIEAQATATYTAPGIFTDANTDGVNDIYAGGLTPVNTDGVDTADYIDTDSDNQGANDTTEAGLTLSGLVGSNGLDNNIDTVDDYTDVNGSINSPTTLPDSDGDLNFGGDVDFRDATNSPPDNDGDGVPDATDLDDDNDGIVDTIEDSPTNVDTDGDGIKNSFDLDSDGDGIPDNIEAQTTTGYIPPSGNDADGDGLDNAYDTNSGGTAITPVNTDGTDNPDYLDTDSDNQGGNDTVEAALTLSGTIGTNGLDNNIDTIDNYTDPNGTINDPTLLPDTDGDVNTGGDVDYRDASNSLDNDNDGIPDVTDLDDDNDGILDTVEGTLDTDGDGIKNSFDLDSDGDGLPDNVEAQATNTYVSPGTFTDANSDGVNDVYAGGITPVNTDGVDTPDYIDTNSDNEGANDTSEAVLVLSGIVGSNGLDNNIDTVDDYSDVNGTINDPTLLPDSDGDLGTGGDVDFRDAIVNILDNDSDGVSDANDLDDDNDGIYDTVEGTGDTDGDGIKNAFDLDSDGDGIPDNVEAQSTLGYITPNGVVDSNGRDTAYPTGLTPVNTDGVDTADYIDTDSDNQGGNDTTEAGLTLSGTIGINGLDNNIDTADDYTDVNGIINDPTTLPDIDGDVNAGGDVDYRDATNDDNDGDGIPNSVDLDDDNDGILDTVEGTLDTDGDGIKNSFDLDSDGDGLPDNVEAQTTTGYIAPGTFTDTNNDGVNDLYAGGLTPVNTDGVDTADYIDTDSDNDGTNDTTEAQLSLSGTIGVNGLDNNIDSVDNYTDPNGNINNPATLPDIDFDVNTGGDVDYRDALYNPNDNDGDGIPDFTDIDDDNDGILDAVEDVPANVDTDGDGIKNSFDLDADNDGIPDNVEAQPTIGYITSSGTDSDGNGLDDAYESVPGAGTGITPQNTDALFTISDTIPDYLDTDSDNEGANDTVEANLNLSGIVGNNGLDNNIDTVDNWTDPNGAINVPSFLPDTDGDVNSGGDVDYRDNTNVLPDNDSDGVPDNTDLDDDNDGILDVIEGGLDSDGDGIKNSFDLDSDGDGIPDNIEAQITINYIAPGTFTDTNSDGVNDVYAGGLTPVNTDGVDTADYLDLDSDNQGNNDTAEAGLALSGTVGNNGLDNNIDTVDDYTDVNGTINDPTLLPNADGINDVDFRDPTPSTPPAGVAGALLWLRADKDVTGTASVTNWNDQSGNNNNATATISPSKINSSLNFNPSINFNGTNQYMQITNGIFGNSTFQNIWVYSVNLTNINNFTYNISQGTGATRFYFLTPDNASLYNFKFGTATAVTAPFGVNTSTFNLWNAGSSIGTATPSSTNKALYRNGLRLATDNASSSITGNSAENLFIGSYDGTQRFMNGEIAEIIIFSTVPSALEQQKVQSYLAMKYGITLDPTNNNTAIVEGDYVAADGVTKPWNYTANATFHNDVAIIGRDNATGVLNQKQSKSINLDALITMGLGTIAADNASSTNNFLANNDFLAWGNNGTTALAATTSTLLCSPEKTLNRTWKVIETGTVGSVKIAATAATINGLLNTPATLKLLKIADDAAFTTNVKYIPLTLETLNGTSEYTANYDFNGIKYITYTELNAIVWNGNSAIWRGGTGTNEAPSINDTAKLLIIDAQTSLTNGFITSPAFVGCTWVRSNSKLIVNNNNSLTIQDQLVLDGEMRMIGNAQLVQKHVGTSQVTGNGSMYIDQLGTTVTTYRYNYWSSPVHEVGQTNYTLQNTIKDGTIRTSENSVPLNIQFTSGYDGSRTSPITLASYWIFTFTNATGSTGWVQRGSTLSIAPPQAFIMKGPGGGTQNYTFVGTPNDGNYTSTITSGNLSLIGNPYPSALDADQFITDNQSSLDGTLYFWEMQGDSGDHLSLGYVGGYSIRNLGMGIAANTDVTGTAGLGNGTYHAPGQFIPVAQGFFVSSSTGGTINFNNAQRAVQGIDGLNSFFFKAGQENNTTINQNKSKGSNDSNRILPPEQQDLLPQLKIGFEYQDPDGKYIHRQIGVNFKEGNSRANEKGFDSYMFDLQATDMYFKFDGDVTKYAIAGLGAFVNTVQIPLGIDMATAGNVNFMVDNSAKLNGTIFIRDLQARRFYNISNGVTTLHLEAGVYQNRFLLTFGNETTLGVDDLLQNKVVLYFDNYTSEVVIRKNNLTIDNVTLFNVLGQKAHYWKSVEDTDEIRLPLKAISNGIYMVNLKTDKGVVSKKIFINK